jgi:hypothetical protein
MDYLHTNININDAAVYVITLTPSSTWVAWSDFYKLQVQ